MFDLIKKMLGNKSQRDIKGIAHIVDQIHVEYERVKELTTDDLRAETLKFRTIIAAVSYTHLTLPTN
jgi:preprotein translocase subunit SecA